MLQVNKFCENLSGKMIIGLKTESEEVESNNQLNGVSYYDSAGTVWDV